VGVSCRSVFVVVSWFNGFDAREYGPSPSKAFRKFRCSDRDRRLPKAAPGPGRPRQTWRSSRTYRRKVGLLIRGTEVLPWLPSPRLATLDPVAIVTSVILKRACAVAGPPEMAAQRYGSISGKSNRVTVVTWRAPANSGPVPPRVRCCPEASAALRRCPHPSVHRR
jgi:hypothetical protein